MKRRSRWMAFPGSAIAVLLLIGLIAGSSQTNKQPARTGKQSAPGTVRQVTPKVPSTTPPADTGSIRLAPAPQDTGRQAAVEQPFEYRKLPNHAFTVGERLTFDVNYGFITAGEAVMSVPAYQDIDGRKCYRVEFTVNSLKSFSWVYKVEDRYLTFIDVDAIAPLRFEQHIREGSYSRDFTADFDQVDHVARTTDGMHPIPPYVHDIMSAFYYFRTFDLSNAKVGDMYSLHNFYKDSTYELGVRILGRQELEVAAGIFRTIVVEPLVKEGGLFKSEGRLVIWLSDDELKIPVRVNTKVLIGSIDTELREYSGLAGPLRARIK
jgi:hypothetical protein